MEDSVMINVLLTGATGFLGSHLLRVMDLEKYNIIIIKRSFSNLFRIADIIHKFKCYDIDKDNLEDILVQNRIDTILHTATDYGRCSSRLEVASANLMFPLNLLFLGVNSGHLKTFINTDTTLDKTINEYGLSKGQFKEWLKLYSLDLKCINVSLEHFYGYQDNKTKFISKIIHLLLNNVGEIDLTLGEQRRDFIHIDDVVNGFIKIFNNINNLNIGFSDFQIGTGKNISIRDCVEIIKLKSGNSFTKLNFGTLPYRKHEVMESCAEISALQTLGWQPNIDFEEGIQKVIQLERNII